jgi:outer membrane receptor protein involved in Fe transport
VRVYGNIYQFADHINQIGMPSFVDFGDAATVGAELRGRYELVPGKLGVTAGTEANYNRTESRAFTEGLEPDGALVDRNFDIEGAYVEVDGQPSSYVGFVGGVRYDRNSVIDNQASPRAALFVAEPEKYGLKLLYAQGFRNPSAYEAFFFDNTSFLQPDHLGAETIRSLEGVLWAKPIPGLSLRASAFYWNADHVVEAVSVMQPDGSTLQQFQNAGHFVSRGVELEASYRDSRGWYGFAGATVAKVGDGTVDGTVPDAAAVTAAGGISTPKLFGHAHLSTELLYIGSRPTRPDADTGAPEPDAPAWLGWNATVYVPNLRGFDVTAGVRNILGTRVLVVTPGDYDRSNSDGTTTTIPRIPGEGREIYVKVGYSY